MNEHVKKGGRNKEKDPMRISRTPPALPCCALLCCAVPAFKGRNGKERCARQRQRQACKVIWWKVLFCVWFFVFFCFDSIRFDSTNRDLQSKHAHGEARRGWQEQEDVVFGILLLTRLCFVPELGGLGGWLAG